MTKRKPLPKKSAVSRVEKIGYDLVRSRKPRGKPVNMRDCAKLTWEPWTREKGMKPNELIPSDEAMLACGVPCRMAYAVMLRTRDELVEGHSKIDHRLVDEMMASFAETSEKLKEAWCSLDGAYARILASAAAFDVKGGKFPDARNLRKTAA